VTFIVACGMKTHDNERMEGVNFYVPSPYHLLMPEENTITRRKTMKLAGAAAATAVVAGCSDDDNGDDGDDEAESFDIEPGTDIELDGQTGGWVGIAPSEIEGVENPTLVLEEGGDYEIGWSEGDGQGHNIEIRDGDDAVVDNLSTDIVDEPDDDQWLEFTADAEMADYVCEPHANAMRGSLEVE